MINYSIIIPHYNIPDLLMRCLKSIPVREDVQVIVVDDCSPDADTYLERYPELSRPSLELYSTEKNGGGGKARNVGLSHAKGRYVIFADADDFFTLCFEKILDDYIITEDDMIIFNANSVDMDYVNANRVQHLNRMVDEYLASECHDTKMLRYAFGEPWCKIIRRSLIEANLIRFDQTPMHNDTFFSYMVGSKVDTISVDRRAGYCVTSRQGSTSKQLSEECLLARMEIFSKKNRFLADNGIDYFDPIFWWSIDYAKNHSDESLMAKCCQVAARYGYEFSFIDAHNEQMEYIRERELRYQKRRRILDSIKKVIHL